MASNPLTIWKWLNFAHWKWSSFADFDDNHLTENDHLLLIWTPTLKVEYLCNLTCYWNFEKGLRKLTHLYANLVTFKSVWSFRCSKTAPERKAVFVNYQKHVLSTSSGMVGDKKNFFVSLFAKKESKVFLAFEIFLSNLPAIDVKSC